MRYRILRLRYKLAVLRTRIYEQIEDAAKRVWFYAEEARYECSREESRAFQRVWNEVTGGEMDNVLPFEKPGQDIPIEAA